MGNLDDLFSAESENIEIHGITPLIRLCKYHPQKKDKFFSGLELAEDLAGVKGVTLYTTGTTITPDRVHRLINLCENNKDLNMVFKIKRSAELINNFRNDIIKKMTQLAEFRKNIKVYSKMMGAVVKDIQKFVEEILSDENMVLTIYKMKFTADSASSKNASLFFFHTLSIALFSYAIAQSDELKDKIGFTEDELKELIKAAFFHNIGGVLNVEDIIKTDESERKNKYYEASRMSASMLNSVKLSFDAMDALRFINEYPFDRDDFVHREDNKACWMANIITVVDQYLQLETGLFGPKKKPSHIIDSLNVEVMNNKKNKTIIKAFTLALNLKDIFDFYMEMDSLKDMCNVAGGKHAVPYPLTGFKSPTIFICKGNREDCEHYEKSLKAVSLMKAMGDIPEGKYARCLLTTPKLLEFYEAHYEEIKKDMKD